LIVALRLPETHHAEHRQSISLFDVALTLLRDKKVMGLGFIVGACNGISFSYYAEGSFYLIKGLGLSPSEFGLSFIALAFSAMMGGMVSKRLHEHQRAETIMLYGLIIILCATSILTIVALIQPTVGMTILCQMGIMFGICMVTSNALALALVHYKSCIGTASSLFGFYYYCLISLFTFGIGWLHNGSLLLMPLYFFIIGCTMLIVQRWIKD
jgi:Na+/melibiose symporter-like transporter